MLRQILTEVGVSAADISTVDQFQGKDRDVVVYSCTRSHETSSLTDPPANGDILNDLRRLNVAITRARAKLIIVGDRKTLQAYDTFRKLFASMQEENILLLKTSDY